MDNQPMPVGGQQSIRVGIVIATLEVGGAERMALAVARALLDAGMDVYFFCLDGGGEMPLPGTPEQQQQLRERITVLNPVAPRSTLAKVKAFPKTLKRLNRLTSDHQLARSLACQEKSSLNSKSFTFLFQEIL